MIQFAYSCLAYSNSIVNAVQPILKLSSCTREEVAAGGAIKIGRDWMTTPSDAVSQLPQSY